MNLETIHPTIAKAIAPHLQFVTQPGNVRVPASTFAEAVKQAPDGETVVGIHAADLPSTRGAGGRVK